MYRISGVDGTYRQLYRILKIIPHDPQQKRILLRILEEAATDPKPIQYDASRIKTLIGEEHSDFLEFILAILVRLAKSDHVYSEEEEMDIRRIAVVFNIKKTLYERILIKIKSFFELILKKMKTKKLSEV